MRLQDFVTQHPRLAVLTGAGVSTASGIPDYRDENGQWKHQKPMNYAEFVASHSARQRYWARSAVGWPRFSRAEPNPAHRALARLEDLGYIGTLITQNVDRLHSRAGSQQVIDLHGLLHEVLCLDCGHIVDRDALQRALVQANPGLLANPVAAVHRPDGDAVLNQFDSASMQIPVCPQCGGVLKPNVVFFGENVPAKRVEACYQALHSADALLVVGSSLQVFSGFRFVRRAVELGLPVAAINRGKTRADDLFDVSVREDCGAALQNLVGCLDPEPLSQDSG